MVLRKDGASAASDEVATKAAKRRLEMRSCMKRFTACFYLWRVLLSQSVTPDIGFAAFVHDGINGDELGIVKVVNLVREAFETKNLTAVANGLVALRVGDDGLDGGFNFLDESGSGEDAAGLIPFSGFTVLDQPRLVEDKVHAPPRTASRT